MIRVKVKRESEEQRATRPDVSSSPMRWGGLGFEDPECRMAGPCGGGCLRDALISGLCSCYLWGANRQQGMGLAVVDAVSCGGGSRVTTVGRWARKKAGGTRAEAARAWKSSIVPAVPPVGRNVSMRFGPLRNEKKAPEQAPLRPPGIDEPPLRADPALRLARATRTRTLNGAFRRYRSRQDRASGQPSGRVSRPRQPD